MAEALEGEAHGVDQIDPGAHQGVAEFEAEQIVLGLGRAVLNRMEQGGIDAGQTGEHLGVPAVAFALVAGDGVELARVGDDHGGAAFLEEAADPGAVGTGFQRDGGVGEVREQLGQRGPGVGQTALTDDLTGGIQNANVMPAIAQIEAEGEPAGNNGAGAEVETTEEWYLFS